MNYFEFYPGDYLRDTTRLTLAEHGAYVRLLMAYYSDEQPLPAENDALFRVVSALEKSEKNAVISVANRFFPVGEDGLRHNARADQEIAKTQGRMSTAPTDRKATQAERAKRYRDRRSAMFALLRENGVVLPFNASSEELEAAVMALAGNGNRHAERHKERDEKRDERDDVPRDVTASRPQTPDPIYQQEQKTSRTPSLPEEPTDAGRACVLMRQAGCSRVNPSNANLLAALDEGITPEALRDTAIEGIGLGKSEPFAWAISTARNRHAEGAAPVSTGPPARQNASKKPPIAQNFSAKTYTGTPDDELPAFLRTAQD